MMSVKECHCSACLTALEPGKVLKGKWEGSLCVDCLKDFFLFVLDRAVGEHLFADFVKQKSKEGELKNK